MITFSETIDKKHTGSGTVPAAFPFPNPFISAAAGLPHGGVFLFPLLRKMSFFAESLNTIVIQN